MVGRASAANAPKISIFKHFIHVIRNGQIKEIDKKKLKREDNRKNKT